MGVSIPAVSLTEAVVRLPLTGTIHAGVDLAWIGLPLASRSWNLTGRVLPVLTTLNAAPGWMLGSLIGCRKPLNLYRLTWYLPDKVLVLPALSVAVAVKE